VLDAQPGPCEDRLETLVIVLVDEDHPQTGVLLRFERVEEPHQFVRAVDRRHDQVERRKLARHGP
jgi:hypothetical protein